MPEHQRDLGALDPAAILRVIAEAQPSPRDPDELHDALLGLVAMPLSEREDWRGWLDALARERRASVVTSPAGPLAFATEHALLIDALYPGAPTTPAPRPLPRPRAGTPDELEGEACRPAMGAATARDEAVLAIVRGHAEIAGPFTARSLADALGLEEREIAVATAQLEAAGVVLRGRFSARGAGGSEPDEEFCDRRLLARIHRQTLDRLRSEIEPVSAQDYLRYLLERHHLTPRSRAGARAALEEAIAMLQGFEIGAAAWEGDILGSRVAAYRPEWLDQLCLAGEVAWVRLTPRRSTQSIPGAPGSTSRATPMTLAFRGEIGWMLGAVRAGESPEPPTSAAATATLDALRRRGALFLDDLARDATLSREEVTGALWDLVGRGLVTGDGFAPLRELLASGRSARTRRGRGVVGLWSMVEDAPRATADDLADQVAGQLLARYGVVVREAVGRESFTVPWRDVARALRRREARGLVRGGRFVAGFLGEQFALPDAVDALRAARRRERTGEVARVRPADPLNLVGILTPGPRVPSTHGGWLVFRDGALVGALADAERAAVASLQ